MIDSKLRQKIQSYAEEREEDITILTSPSYDKSIIGISSNGRLVYDRQKMIKELMKDDNIEEEEALEFFDYNTMGALNNLPNPPIIVENLISEIKATY